MNTLKSFNPYIHKHNSQLCRGSHQKNVISLCDCIFFPLKVCFKKGVFKKLEKFFKLFQNFICLMVAIFNKYNL